MLTVLVDNNLVTQPTLFELHASLTGKATQVKVGTFFLDYRWTPSELLHHLVEGTSPAIRKLRLPPGLNQWKVAARVEKAGLGTGSTFEELMRSAHLPDMLGLSIPAPDPKRFKDLDLSYRAPLEGYLFPGTYEFPWEAGEGRSSNEPHRRFAGFSRSCCQARHQGEGTDEDLQPSPS